MCSHFSHLSDACDTVSQFLGAANPAFKVMLAFGGRTPLHFDFSCQSKVFPTQVCYELAVAALTSSLPTSELTFFLQEIRDWMSLFFRFLQVTTTC